MNETIEDILLEMRDAANLAPSAVANYNMLLTDNYYDDECQGWLTHYADRIGAAYKNLPGMWIIPAENAKLREENERLKAALKPVQDAHIPDFSICDTCQDKSDCEEYEHRVTCEWYDIVEAVRKSQRIYNGEKK